MAIDYQPLFVLSSGMLLQERKLSVITNNLANIDTPSFKKDLVEVGSWFTDNGVQVRNEKPDNPSNNFVYPMMVNIYTDLSQGPLKETGNPLDVAIEGDGFFAVRTPNGVLFTRKGNFRVDHESYLVTEEGFRVLDRNNAEIRLEGSTIHIDSEGNIYVDENLSATLGVWNLENPVKVGEDFFRGTPQPAENFRLMHGFVELSNVNPILEMVRLIETSRAHEVYSRLVQALDEVQGKANNIAR